MVDTVETPDDYAVILNLKEPFGAMINTVAHPSVVIHSPKALEELGKDVDKTPVGTGPFVFKEWVPGERVVLEKNENYWDSEWPKVDTVTFYPVTESATASRCCCPTRFSSSTSFLPSYRSGLRKMTAPRFSSARYHRLDRIHEHAQRQVQGS